MQAVYKALDPQLLGTDPTQRRDRTVQDVIQAPERVSGFNRRDIVRLFDYADLRLFTVRIAAEQAERAVADVVAAFADAELVFNIENGLRQVFGIFARRAKQMKSNPLRRFLADSRQPFAFLNEPGQRLRELGPLE